MRILFLNQYFPPDPAPTGILLRELADHFAAQGHETQFVSSGQDYRAAKKNQRRTLRELRALWGIFSNALKASPQPDVIISATSPPLLAFVAALVAWWHHARHVHWLFDMYPDLAFALGEIKRGAATHFFQAIMRWAYRRTDMIVVLDEDMASRLAQYGVRAKQTVVIPPWVFASLLATLSAEMLEETCGGWPMGAPIRDPQSAMPTWLYSGNLGRAHEWQTLLEAQSILEKRGSKWRLVFQGGGPSWPLAQARANELQLRNCEWKPYVPESELRDSLLSADVLVVTQRPETQGLLWPSKLALVTSLPRRILWVGPTDGAIAHELRPLPQAGIFGPDQAAEIADWLETGGAGSSSIQTRDAVAIRLTALQKWSEFLPRLTDVQR